MRDNNKIRNNISMHSANLFLRPGCHPTARLIGIEEDLIHIIIHTNSMQRL